MSNITEHRSLSVTRVLSTQEEASAWALSQIQIITKDGYSINSISIHPKYQYKNDGSAAKINGYTAVVRGTVGNENELYDSYEENEPNEIDFVAVKK